MSEPLPGPSLMSRRIAHLMDDAVTVPGTRVGVGLDALIGLVPGIGDVLGSTISGTILVDAVRQRVPVAVLARMGLNLIIDALLGLIPGVGDLLDVAHRANRKNYRLLEAHCAQGGTRAAPTVGYLVQAVALIVATLATVVAVAVLGLYLLIRVLFG